MRSILCTGSKHKWLMWAWYSVLFINAPQCHASQIAIRAMTGLARPDSDEEHLSQVSRIIYRAWRAVARLVDHAMEHVDSAVVGGGREQRVAAVHGNGSQRARMVAQRAVRLVRQVHVKPRQPFVLRRAGPMD